MQAQIKSKKITLLALGANVKCLTVSKVGRVALIQANIESMPAHTMQCFQLPKETNRLIDKISRDFFLKKTNDNKGLPISS